MRAAEDLNAQSLQQGLQRFVNDAASGNTAPHPGVQARKGLLRIRLDHIAKPVAAQASRRMIAEVHGAHPRIAEGDHMRLWFFKLNPGCHDLGAAQGQNQAIPREGQPLGKSQPHAKPGEAARPHVERKDLGYSPGSHPLLHCAEEFFARLPPDSCRAMHFTPGPALVALPQSTRAAEAGLAEPARASRRWGGRVARSCIA